MYLPYCASCVVGGEPFALASDNKMAYLYQYGKPQFQNILKNFCALSNRRTALQRLYGIVRVCIQYKQLRLFGSSATCGGAFLFCVKMFRHSLDITDKESKYPAKFKSLSLRQKKRQANACRFSFITVQILWQRFYSCHLRIPSETSAHHHRAARCIPADQTSGRRRSQPSWYL